MPKRKRAKVKTKAEDIGDLSVAVHQYERFKDQAESDIAPDRTSRYNKHPTNLRKGGKGRVIDPSERPYIPEVSPGSGEWDEWARPGEPEGGGTLLRRKPKTTSFYPGRSKF